MRPQLSTEEAKFLCNVLENEKHTSEAKAQQLTDKIQRIQLQIEKAKQYIKKGCFKEAKTECNFPLCKEELVNLVMEETQLERETKIHNKLLAKYRLLSEGKGKGRYPRAAHKINENINDLNEPVFVPSTITHGKPLYVKVTT